MQNDPSPENPSQHCLTKSDHEKRFARKPCRFWCLSSIEKHKNEILRLQDRIRALEGEVALRDSLFGKDFEDKTFEGQEAKLKAEFPFYSKFTIQEREVFRVLLRHKGSLVRKEAIFQALFSHKPESDWPDDKTLDVVVCKMRKKMGAATPWAIETQWGEGRRLIRRKDL